MEMIITTNNIVGLNKDTSRRASVVAHRTGNTVMGIIKSQLIDLLKTKMRNGIAHFVFQKKDGSIREAWGTTAKNLMKANINGNGMSRDAANCIAYWDVEKGGFRSLRFESLIQVF